MKGGLFSWVKNIQEIFFYIYKAGYHKINYAKQFIFIFYLNVHRLITESLFFILQQTKNGTVT